MLTSVETVMSAERERAGERGVDACGDGLGLALSTVAEQQRELVASEPGEQVVVPQLGGQSAAEADEQPVARRGARGCR